MLISDRSKEIIENLMNANGPLTVAALAKKLNVTERTIYRQIPEVTQIMESYDLSLDNSSGKGFMIFGSLYNIKRLNNAFEEVKTEQNYSSKERVDIILLSLLNEDDYIKTQSLAIDLNTSSQTVRNDYHALKDKLQGHNVTFETKKSEGVRLTGMEIPKRHLFVNVLLQNITPAVFFDWIKDTNFRPNPFIDLLKTFHYEEDLKMLYEKLQPVIRKRHLNISDKELQEFLLLMTVFIKRHSNIEDIYQSNPKLYEIVKQCFRNVFQPVKIPEDEIGYIVIYFIASMDSLSKHSISVLVVCSTGIGSSKMLRSRLEREFSEIDVKKIISLHKLHDENLEQYDLIISTVPIDMDESKYLCVSPLLNVEEKENVKKKINQLNRL